MLRTTLADRGAPPRSGGTTACPGIIFAGFATQPITQAIDASKLANTRNSPVEKAFTFHDAGVNDER